MLALKPQILVDEGDGHAAFANAAGDPLYGAVANVARADNARQIGFEREGFATCWPPDEVAPGTDVTPWVTLKLLRKPIGVRGRADHQEESARVSYLGRFFAFGRAVSGDDPLDIVFAFDTCDLRVRLDVDIGAGGDLVYKISRHAYGVAGKRVFIVGGGNSAGQAAVFFAGYAAQVVMLIRGPGLTLSIEALHSEELGYCVRLDDGVRSEARAILLATGVEWHRMDNVPGMEDLQGRGILYGASRHEAAIWHRLGGSHEEICNHLRRLGQLRSFDEA